MTQRYFVKKFPLLHLIKYIMYYQISYVQAAGEILVVTAGLQCTYKIV